MNKIKIVNDPVYGFISVPKGIILDVLQHSYFQRLRRIVQLGLTNYVYPGANHTRFHHALGAMHLMQKALTEIRNKGTKITDEEFEGACLAILLHDVGHGAFSHTLENTLIPVHHEEISLAIMEQLNKEFDGQLDVAIQIFKNQHSKKFLNQLVSSQLDVDRLDYLSRDSFFTGVSEGVISYDRIISMLNVIDHQLVVESKGIYSVEKFLMSRQLMYWQVYLHKTVVGVENMLIQILKRAQEIYNHGAKLFAAPSLTYFLEKNSKGKFGLDEEVLKNFTQLDDFDILSSIKVWAKHEDEVLSFLCTSLVNRNLYKTEVSTNSFSEKHKQQIIEKIERKYPFAKGNTAHFLYDYNATIKAYKIKEEPILISYKSGEVVEINEASEQLNITALSKQKAKYFLSYPKL